jgi:hypothetical protein
MTAKTLLIFAGAALALFLAVRSMAGYETTAEHLYGGEMVEITCDNGQPTGGEGVHLASARQACEQERSDQRRWVPWLVGAGVILIVWGVVDVRSGRSR